MAHCYQCGRFIDPSKRYQRRRVQTGDSLQRSYPQESVKSFRKTYGQRIVCSWCASQIDRMGRQRVAFDLVVVMVALLLVAAFFTLY